MSEKKQTSVTEFSDLTREDLERALRVIRTVGTAALRGETIRAPSDLPEDLPEEKAYEIFIRELRLRLGEELWESISVTTQQSWVQFAGPSDRVYVAKSATISPRVESTLDPDLIEGAVVPDRRNGKIRSLLPSTVEAVARAITIIADRQ